MSGPAISSDGTAIAYDRCGSGPAVVLVHGAFTDRSDPTLATVAAGLAPWFTVFKYDRRGRGGSGDTQPYAVAREIDDLAAVIGAAGGSAAVFGGSSGGALVLAAAGQNASIAKVAVWEPPYHVDAAAPRLAPDFDAQLRELVEAGRRGDAVELFLVEAAELPHVAVAAMRADASWSRAEAVAHTLAYEASVLGPDNVLPADRLALVTQPTLVLTGADSPGWMTRAGEAVAAAVPHSVHRVLERQSHNVAAEALVPELLEFFVAAGPGAAASRA